MRRVGSWTVISSGEARCRHGRVDVGLRSRSGSTGSIVTADAPLPGWGRGELIDQLLESDPFIVRAARLLACLEVWLALLDQRSLLLPYQTVTQFFCTQS